MPSAYNEDFIGSIKAPHPELITRVIVAVREEQQGNLYTLALQRDEVVTEIPLSEDEFTSVIDMLNHAYRQANGYNYFD
ncbi:MAG: hypothetical protein AB7D03_03675 [Thiomicrospira sp.]